MVKCRVHLFSWWMTFNFLLRFFFHVYQQFQGSLRGVMYNNILMTHNIRNRRAI